MRQACVIGWPIDHSRSPLIHGYWLKHYGIDGNYSKVAVAPAELAGFLAGMRKTYVGANVTIPHKAAVAGLCDRLTDRARRLGVVNTIWFEGDTLCGDTTDGEGFLAALDAEAPGWRNARRALVLGAGGAAPPIVEAILACGLEVTVANRTPEKAKTLAGVLGCNWGSWEDVPILMPTTDLLVNTTAAGLKGSAGPTLDLAALRPTTIVDDIVYVPRMTPLQRDAEARGLRTVGGLGMLLHQAVPGFAHWFGIRPEVTADLRARLEADVDEKG